MRSHPPKSVPRHRSCVPFWTRAIRVIAVIAAFEAMLPIMAKAHPQTRGGFTVGLDLARGTAAVSSGGSTSSREGGWGGGFRLGYAPNPKFALGLESNTWVDVSYGSAITLGTTTAAVSVFPAEGLVLRGGVGEGHWAGAGGGTSGEVGTGWMLGAGYEFRVARSFAIGPQIHYNQVNLQNVDYNFVNVAFAMNWYFIPE